MTKRRRLAGSSPSWLERGYRIPHDSNGEDKSIDYVVGILDEDEESIVDFVGVEGQALDTASGSVWPFRQACLDDDAEMKDADGSFYINWSMSLTKTMMQQALNKGTAFQNWGKNLVFIVRDVSIEYLRSNTAAGLRSARDSDPVHFYSYTMVFDDSSNEFGWEPGEKLSADLDAIAEMMRSDDFPGVDEFEDELVERLG